MRSRTRTRRAFTIVELLVVVAVVGLLTAVLLFTLHAVMDRRNDIADLSNLGATMKDFHAWSADHNGQMLNAGMPGDPGSAWFFGGATPETHGWTTVAGAYQGQVFLWPRILHRWLGESRAYWHATGGPDFSDGDELDQFDGSRLHEHLTHYHYSYSFYTSAECWQDPSIRISLEAYALEHFRTVFVEQIAHPSSKGALIYSEYRGSVRGHPVAFADGSASFGMTDAALPAAMHPVYEGRMGPVLGTLNGYEGRDFGAAP